MLYRCYLRNRAGRTIGWKPIRSDSDAGARRLAISMLRERAEIHNLETWHQADLVFRLSKIDAAPSQI